MAPFLSTTLVKGNGENTLTTSLSIFISAGGANSQNRTREGYYKRILKLQGTKILNYGFYFKQP